MAALSWTTIVVHGRDDEGVGADHEVNSPNFLVDNGAVVKLSLSKLSDRPEMPSTDF